MWGNGVSQMSLRDFGTPDAIDDMALSVRSTDTNRKGTISTRLQFEIDKAAGHVSHECIVSKIAANLC